MNGFAFFEDGHIENIDIWKEEPDGDVRFFIGSQEYLYHEYIDDVYKDILDRSPDTVFFYKSHVFYKVDHWNDPMYLVVPIKYIEVNIPENILKGEEKNGKT